MKKHIRTGHLGENLAFDYFRQNGYTILEKNWRYKRWEVDLIASKQQILHFIEVKTRRTDNYGNPEDLVNDKKIDNLMNAAEAYLFKNPDWKRIQFDILAIKLLKDQAPEYFLIEDIS